MNIDIGVNKIKQKPYLLVYATDFGDNYHKTDDQPSSDLEALVRKIRRRYSDYQDYIYALSNYNEYMNFLYKKYGNEAIFEIMYESGIIEDFVPPKPQMKNNSFNRFLLKNKVMISKGVRNIDVDENMAESYIESLYTEKDIEEALERKIKTEDVSKNKLAKKLIKEESGSHYTRQIKNITDLDYFEEYFNTKNQVTGKKKNSNECQLTFTDLLEGNFETEETGNDADDLIFYNGSFMDRDSMEELQTLQKMGEYGWDTIRILRSRRNLGKNNKMIKLIKKKEKSERKKKKGKGKKDNFLTKMITDGNFTNFEDYEEEMLNFTADNVFK